MKRRRFVALGAGGAAAGLLGWGAGIEPGLLAVSRHTVTLAGSGAREGGSAGGGVLRIAHLPDLHLAGIDAFHEEVSRTLAAFDPHLIVLVGDTIDRADRLPLAAELVELVRTPSARCLAVMGNWEYQAGLTPGDVAPVLGRAGAELLVNRSVLAGPDGARILVTGLDDWRAGAPDLQAALGPPGSAGPEEAHLRAAGHHLVLAHCPIHRDELGAAQAARPGHPPIPWVLSGHTHGGQVGLGPLRFTPSGSGDYVQGWYRGGLPHLYVSRGLGSRVPIRIGARPELALFEVHLA